MDDRYKRLNSQTGKPFQTGFQDTSGRFFLRYLDKQGNDGYYLEDWKKDKSSFLEKLKEIKAKND